MPTDPTFPQTLAQQKRQSTLQLLFKAARLCNERALERVRAGAPDLEVRPAHSALFPHIDLDGTRITTLAARTGITKQAVGQLVDDLERMGMVHRVADPADGRARLVCFTDAGRQALLHGLGVLMALQADLARAIGPDRMDALHEALTALLAELEAPR